MSSTLVPSLIVFVCAATKVSVSSGSSTWRYSLGRDPSGVPGYGTCNLSGYNKRSIVHKLVYPRASARCAIVVTDSVVAIGPMLGREKPIFMPHPRRQDGG